MQISEKLESTPTQASFKKKTVTHYQKDKTGLYMRALVSPADVMLNERSQTPKSIYTIPFTCGSGPELIHGDRERKMLTSGRGS